MKAQSFPSLDKYSEDLLLTVLNSNENIFAFFIFSAHIFLALKSRITPTPKALAAGTKQTRPAHIPAHLPPLPDPHSYIKTPVSFNFS